VRDQPFRAFSVGRGRIGHLTVKSSLQRGRHSRHFFSPEPALDAWTAAKDRNDPRIAPLAASPSGSLPGHSNGTSLVSLELRPRSVTTGSRLVTQADRSDAGRDVETGAAFETERLKRDRSAGTADQHIGPGGKFR
jgi:hypothetical protein